MLGSAKHLLTTVISRPSKSQAQSSAYEHIVTYITMQLVFKVISPSQLPGTELIFQPKCPASPEATRRGQCRWELLVTLSSYRLGKQNSARCTLSSMLQRGKTKPGTLAQPGISLSAVFSQVLISVYSVKIAFPAALLERPELCKYLCVRPHFPSL